VKEKKKRVKEGKIVTFFPPFFSFPLILKKVGNKRKRWV